MQEKKVVATISLDDVVEEKESKEKETQSSPTKKKENNLVIETAVVVGNEEPEYLDVDEKIRQARAEYITTDISLKDVATKYDISERKLKKHMSQGKWNILKRSADLQEFMIDVVNDIYGTIDVFEYIKHLSLTCLRRGEYQNPKDIAILTQTFKMANDEITKLRVANVNNQNVNVVELKEGD